MTDCKIKNPINQTNGRTQNFHSLQQTNLLEFKLAKKKKKKKERGRRKRRR